MAQSAPWKEVDKGIRAVHMQSSHVWDVHLWFPLAVCYEPHPTPPCSSPLLSLQAAEWVSTYKVGVLWSRRAEARWGQEFWGLRTMWVKRMKSNQSVQRVCQQLFWATEREDLLSNLRPQPFLFPQRRLVQHCRYAKNYCVEIWPQRLSYTRTTSRMATFTPREAGTKLWEDPKLSLQQTSQKWRPVSWSAHQALRPRQYNPHVTNPEPLLEGVWGSDFNSYCWKNESFTLFG